MSLLSIIASALEIVKAPLKSWSHPVRRLDRKIKGKKNEIKKFKKAHPLPTTDDRAYIVWLERELDELRDERLTELRTK